MFLDPKDTFFESEILIFEFSRLKFRIFEFSSLAKNRVFDFWKISSFRVVRVLENFEFSSFEKFRVFEFRVRLNSKIFEFFRVESSFEFDFNNPILLYRRLNNLTLLIT